MMPIIIIKFEPNGEIMVKYNSIKFWLNQEDFSVDKNRTIKIISNLVKNRYLNRHNYFMTNGLTVLPPQDNYVNSALSIIKSIKRSPEFPIWQIMNQ